MDTVNGFYTSSPAVLLPNLPSQPMSNGHYANHSSAPLSMDGITSDVASHSTDTAIEAIQPTPGSIAGRKRSRGEIHASEEDDYFADGSVPTSSIPDPDSMTDDSSAARPGHVKRPSFTSRKSQRIDSAAGSQDHLAQLVLPPQMREVTDEPLIDEATRALGISWTRMDSTDTFRIRQAAYSKWIQNHYPSLKKVSVWFENSAIPCYLAEATNVYGGQQEFYLLSNDLTEARLVTSDAQQLIPRLRMLPAIHLAAPGGCLKAETDPITAAQNEVDSVQTDMADASQNNRHVYAHHRPEPSTWSETKLCSAHAMEMD